MKNERKFGLMTRAVHMGQGSDKDSGAIRRPITMANSYALPEDLSKLSWSTIDINIYTRNGGANQKFLEQKLADLEEGESCIVLASGVAALHALFFETLKSGDHVVVSDNTYIAAYRLLHELLPFKYGVESTLVDSSDPANIRAAIRPNTKLVHIETPANPSLKITDVRAVAKIAHDAGALLSVDNTFASPCNQLPLKLGADIVIESLTKFINGHGDSLGGAIIGPEKLLYNIRLNAQVNVGGVISPFNAWLIMRGAATLPLRMAHINESSQKIAEYLASDPDIRFVWYPGLPSHPGHDIAKAQMTGGFGGMIAFDFRGDMRQHIDILRKFKVVTPAASLGHDESLIIYIPPDDERVALFPEPHRQGFFRFSIGLEDTDDVIWDLRQAMDAVAPTAYRGG
jgi:methionine-gamma-lyase